MADWRLGARLAYRIVEGATERVYHGILVWQEQDHAVLATPAVGDQGCAVTSAGEDDVMVDFQAVQVAHLVAMEEAVVNGDTEVRTFETWPDSRAAARAYLTSGTEAASVHSSERPRGRVAAARRAPPAAPEVDRGTLPHLASAAPLWGALQGALDEGDESESDEQEDEAQRGPRTNGAGFRLAPAVWDAAPGPALPRRDPTTYEAATAMAGMPGFMNDPSFWHGAMGSSRAGPSAGPWGPPPAPANQWSGATPGPAAPRRSSGQDPASYVLGPPPAPPYPPQPAPGAWPHPQMAAGFDPQVQLLMQMKMLKALDRLGKKRSEDSGSDSDERNGGLPAHMVGGFRGVARARRRFKKYPRRIVQSHLDRVQQELGVTHASQFWQLRDHSRKLRASFGKMVGLWRAHYIIAEALQHQLENRPDHCSATLALALEAIHQVALDDGDWLNASLMLPFEDPLAKAQFGGSEEQMAEITRYRRALKDLRSRTEGSGSQPGGGPPAANEEAEEPAGKGSGRRRGKK